MSCCALIDDTEAAFGPRVARADLRRYHKRGPDDTTRRLIEGVRATGVRDVHLLDVGAGIGVLHHELLGECASRATHVEVSAACNEVAREEDARRGHGTQVHYLAGDALELPLPDADVVVLDRAICCYPDWEALVRHSAARAGQVYAFSLLRETWYTRGMTGFGNFVRVLRGLTFRVLVQPIGEIDRVVEAMGLERVSTRTTAFWHVAVYRRVGEG